MPRRIDGAKVIALMEERDWTNADLAEHSHLSVSTIGRIKKNEAHNSSNITVRYLARAFGCQPADLYKEEAIKEAINESLTQTVTNVVAEAVAEAVTVVVDEVAPSVSPETVAKNIPPIELDLPIDFNAQLYFDRIEAAHKQQVSLMEAAHSEHLRDLRKDKRNWQIISAISFVVVIVCFVFSLR